MSTMRPGIGAWLVLAVMVALAQAGRPAAGEPQGDGRTYALLIGLNYDHDPAMSAYQLRYSANDAKAVREMLVSYCGVDAADIEMLGDDDRPTPRVIMRKLSELAARAGPRDRILLFYSGHGVTHRGAWAMVPYDFSRDDIDGTLMWNRDITRIMDESQAGEMIFISDSCYSGSDKSLPASLMARNPDFGSKDPSVDGGQRYIELEFGGLGDLLDPPPPGAKGIGRTRGIVRLCSSGAGEVSREYPPARLGAFTHALSQSVRNWWDETSRGELTVGSVYVRIVPEVEKTGRHTPHLSGDGDGIVLAEKGLDRARPGPAAGGRVYALLIGLRYLNDNMTPNDKKLNYTENDAREFRRMLLEYGGSEERDITVLTDADRPDRGRIVAELRRLAGRAGPEDSIIFFFSGHGGRRSDYGNIIPHRYRRWEDGVAYATDIKPLLEGSRAAFKWMIVDACHSGLKSFGFSGEKALDGGIPERETANLDMFVKDYEEYGANREKASAPPARVPDLIRFTGANGGEVTYETGRLAMAYFAHYLVKGFSGAADNNRDGVITGGELAEYVTPKVAAATKNRQRPRLTANGYHVVVASRKSPAPSAPANPGSSGDAPVPAAPVGPAGSGNLNAVGDDGRTALQNAVAANDLARSERLLAVGADPNAVDATGWTALHYAASPEAVKLLIARGARMNSRSGSGYTPLHAAAILNRHLVIAELLRNGADRSLKDKWGRTALHHAMKNRHREAAGALVGE